MNDDLKRKPLIQQLQDIRTEHRVYLRDAIMHLIRDTIARKETNHYDAYTIAQIEADRIAKTWVNQASIATDIAIQDDLRNKRDMEKKERDDARRLIFDRPGRHGHA